MAINDDRLARNVEHVRTVVLEKARLRVARDLAVHTLSDRLLEDVVRLVSEERVARLTVHPAFPAVVKAVAAQESPGVHDPGLLGHAMRDANKMTAAILALYLDATPGGLTHARLDALTDLAGVGGRAKTHALIAYMRFLGYIEPAPAEGDGRERRYRPTPRMREAFRRFFIDRMTALLPIAPELGPGIARIARDDDFRAFMAIIGEGLVILAMQHKLNDGPSLDVFSRRRSGLITLWRLMLSAPPEDSWPPQQRFRFSAIDLARKGSVARSHVQRLLRDAAAVGMLEIEDDGWVRVTPLLRGEVNAYIAILAITLGYCCRELMGLPAAASAAG